MTSHTASQASRETLFNAIRDYPDLCAVELSMLTGAHPSHISSQLTSLYDAGLVSRYKKAGVAASGSTSSIYHYRALMQVFNRAHKVRKTPDRISKSRPIIYETDLTPAPTAALTASVNALLAEPSISAHIMRRASDVITFTAPPSVSTVDDLIETIQNLPYRDVVRLKARLSEVFA